jgi:tRNA pseudouridine32 synthase/23S rRNA pseudouridine746 synthase
VHVTWFDPQPVALPDRVPSPFAIPREPLALRAIEELRRDAARFAALAKDGKMFGVLVVAAPDGRIGYLRAFSGMLGGTWFVDGYAPPVFDHARRETFWPTGEAELARIDAELVALDARLAPMRAALATLDDRHRTAVASLDARHAVSRAARHAARAALGTGSTPPSTSDHEPSAAKRTNPIDQLARQSQAEGSERKRLVAAQRAEREPSIAAIEVLETERATLEHRKAARSRELLVAIHETYTLANARGDIRSLREIFAPAEPPGGAGDCAAPKLLAHAYREGLRPISFAEVWCGAPPPTGDRHDGTLYPACRGKCGPILAHALGGLATDELPIFGLARSVPDPVVLYQDDWLVIVDKPVGLLSVPGRGEQLRDCVQARLRKHHPALLLAHRLDLDTSGVLLAAKDLATYGALQRQFEERRIAKRYIAWVAGRPHADEGTIELALRVDLDDRPRQIVDDIHGKPAITAWRVLDRAGDRTRVAFHPHTGRTHQLRVHASHPRGLDAAIIGDRLYSRVAHDEPRLLLHAEALRFAHPHTGETIAIEAPAPF